MRSGVLLSLSLWTWSVPGAAQLPLQGPAPSVLFGYGRVGPLHPTAGAQPRDSLRQRIAPTYWMEGALIGGALGAVGGALLTHRLCGLAEESTENCTRSVVLGTVLSAALLAIPGALIGGQVSKRPAEGKPPD